MLGSTLGDSHFNLNAMSFLIAFLVGFAGCHFSHLNADISICHFFGSFHRSLILMDTSLTISPTVLFCAGVILLHASVNSHFFNDRYASFTSWNALVDPPGASGCVVLAFLLNAWSNVSHSFRSSFLEYSLYFAGSIAHSCCCLTSFFELVSFLYAHLVIIANATNFPKSNISFLWSGLSSFHHGIYCDTSSIVSTQKLEIVSNTFSPALVSPALVNAIVAHGNAIDSNQNNHPSATSQKSSAVGSHDRIPPNQSDALSIFCINHCNALVAVIAVSYHTLIGSSNVFLWAHPSSCHWRSVFWTHCRSFSYWVLRNSSACCSFGWIFSALIIGSLGDSSLFFNGVFGSSTFTPGSSSPIVVQENLGVNVFCSHWNPLNGVVCCGMLCSGVVSCWVPGTLFAPENKFLSLSNIVQD